MSDSLFARLVSHLRAGALLLGMATLLGCSSLPSTQAAPPALMPVRQLVADWYGSGNYRLSPDGQRLMWVARLGLGPGLFVQHLDSGKVHRYPVAGGGVWARDSRHILLHLQRQGDENTHVVVLDSDQADLQLRDLTPFAGARSHIVRTLPHSNDVIIASNRRDPTVDDVFRYHMDTGELRLLATNPGNVGQWLVDDQGDIVARARLQGEEWLIEKPATDPERVWVGLFRISYFDSLLPLAASATPGHWWALSNRGRDKMALVEVRLNDGSERVAFTDERVDVSQWVWSERRRTPLAVSTEPDMQRWHAWDPVIQQALQTLQGDTQARVQIHTLSDDERWLSATVIRHNGGEHVLYDLHTHSVRVLAELSRSRIHARSPLTPHQPIDFKSRDGLTVHGYLSEPAGVAKPYPTVVYVHGGPWVRDFHHDNDPMLALLTNRGYAVLQVNYRGSKGYGKRFMEAAQGQFADHMHSDLIDAVDALAAQGVVDPQRTAIIGASYGGYASLVGMTHTPGRFRCAISTAGMSDIAALLDEAPPYWALGKPHWIRYVGDPSEPSQRAAMQERSPLYKVHNVQGPILLMHGVHDARVKVGQSQRMADALRAHGKSVELVLFDQAGHSFERWQDRLVAMRKTEDFLASCLGGRTRGFDFFQLGVQPF